MILEMRRADGHEPQLWQAFDAVDGEIVADLWVLFARLPGRFVATIEYVNTREGFRRQGRATALVLEAIEKARELGCDCVELTVREDEPGIQAFYASLGFVDRKNRAMRLVL